jgi:glycosyltransferase involved in cell wall biosynthesis
MKVTVITATTGNPLLAGCLRSVAAQTHPDVEHLVFSDGMEHWEKIEPIFNKEMFPNGTTSHFIELPYSVGKDRWNGHRMYAAGIYLARGDYVMFLDEDNSIEPSHIEDCLKVIENGNDWAFSFRNIVDKQQNFLCQDNCENLGKWASVMHPEDYFVDVNCYFLPKILAVQTSPIWYRKAREPGVPEVDRALTNVLRQIAPKYDTTYKYTVNYTVGNSSISVQDTFFAKGNAEMMRRYGGKLPWQK